MANGLVKCGASDNVKSTIFRLWVAYLNNLRIAFVPPDQPEETQLEEEEDPEMLNLNPEWMSQPVPENDNKSVKSNEPSCSKKLPFAPLKL